MSENFFQIDKKDVVSKFKAYAKKHSERSDEYNPKNAKQTANHRNYFVLDRIRALYHWIIKEAKLDLRRMYIHNDKTKFCQISNDKFDTINCQEYETHVKCV